ncbi:hypothetical protein [Picosynechococcus sp. PCC 8807]|uniref:hypothetical protein n=1 Tax=Picosynechococcus sp. PCC 8807 TaxID=195248 RepID=UPI00081065B3|nr:hypothetical protein [Picosynechococcus sp. PCC 8807]ANV92055.1 hypothetical protein AWQ24_14850 [Picosynechococcus sp. PCC 8807]
MPKELQITKLSFVVLARSHNPSLLNPDFLKNNGIVGNDWEVDSTLTTDQISQTVFKNNFNIQMRADRVIFEQSTDENFDLDKFQLCEVASRFLETLPHVNYTALGINPTGHVIFDTEDELDIFISEKLLRSGDWKIFRGVKPEVAFSFSYPFNSKNIQLSINNVIVSNNKTNKKSLGILFSGNIHYDFASTLVLSKKNDHLRERLLLWKDDLDDYYSLINDCFLKS